MSALSKLNTAQVDKLNIGLMFFSLILAYLLPFELFLFSYAVLGPLHYLTEVSWLHQKEYYIPNNKKRLWAFPILAALLTLVLISDELGKMLGFKLNPEVQVWGTNIIFFLFAVSFILIILKKTWQKILSFALIGILVTTVNFNSACITCTNPTTGAEKSICNESNAATNTFVRTHGVDKNGDGMISLSGADNCVSKSQFPAMALLFGAYIPTLIHVFFFTMFFMLFGALKSKSKYGYLAVVTMIICGIIPFVFDPPFISYHIGEQTKQIYNQTFLTLNKTIFSTFHLGPTDVSSIYESNMGIMLTRFIAFAYTYHYLNWFSKTSIIQWHKVPKLNLAVVLILWIVSVGLYAYNYVIGFTALLFLSFIHVFVEFPLNFQSFRGIIHALVGKKIQTAN
jgi:hypothetical protein